MKTCQDSKGIALVVVIIIMVIFLSITGASLLLSGLNLKSASNYKSGTAGLNTADAGMHHALAVIPAGTNFSYGSGATVVPVTPFVTASSGFSYTVSATNDPPTSPSTSRAILTSTATGPNGSKRVVQAYIGRSIASWAPPGAVYIPAGSGSDANFNTAGTFFITGNDTNYSADVNLDGRADSTSAGPRTAIYGAATSNSSINAQFVNSLTSTEKTKVQGKDYNASTSPATPSVFTSAVSINVTDLVNSFKSEPGAVQYLSGLSRSATDCPTPRPNPPLSTCVFGTDAAPQITYIKQDSGTMRFDTGSTVTGSGVLIIEGKANLFGNFEFHGIVISLAQGLRGREGDDSELKFKLKDDARIFGALLLGPTGDQLKFDIKDRAAIYYSSQAINPVQTNWGSVLPQSAKLIAWHEVMQ